MWIIAAVRVLGSMPVLRWAFAGAFAAILIDFGDLFLRNLIDLGGVRDYQRFDKFLDLVYMGTFARVAAGWSGLGRRIAMALLAFRMAGFVAFELSGSRSLLLAFPNVFEFWFVFMAGWRQWRGPDVGPRAAALALPTVTALKLFQEYALHEAKWLDDFTAVEAVEAIWDMLLP
jgi:hypothetical protein